jgi:hypothetical protein
VQTFSYRLLGMVEPAEEDARPAANAVGDDGVFLQFESECSLDQRRLDLEQLCGKLKQLGTSKNPLAKGGLI